MPEVDTLAMTSFASPAELGAWLAKHHASETELWIKIYKKGTGVPSVTWNDVVLETLCWGWIDGVKKSLGDEAYVQRITPRKPRSNWSKKNTEHVETLIAEGRMQEPGLAQVRAAREDGRWEQAYAPAREMTVPDDFLEAVAKKRKVQRFFETLNKSARYVIAYHLATAKKPETRQRRFDKYMDMLVRGETPDFGFNKKKS